MANEQMYLVVTIRKPVPDRETADQLQALVKDRLADKPDLIISAHVVNHFADDE
jgi:hypothetical protein